MFPLGILIRRLAPMTLLMMVLLALITGPWELERWSHVPPRNIAAAVAVLLLASVAAAALAEWENRRERRRWTVEVRDGLISVADEKGRTTEMPTSALELVVATSSLSAWRDDLDLALFDERDGPLISFPLVASGGDRFIEWLSSEGGFQPGELAAVRASARLDSRPIWSAD